MLPKVIGEMFVSTSGHDLVRAFLLEFGDNESKMNGECLTTGVSRLAMSCCQCNNKCSARRQGVCEKGGKGD